MLGESENFVAGNICRQDAAVVLTTMLLVDHTMSVSFLCKTFWLDVLDVPRFRFLVLLVFLNANSRIGLLVQHFLFSLQTISITFSKEIPVTDVFPTRTLVPFQQIITVLTCLSLWLMLSQDAVAFSIFLGNYIQTQRVASDKWKTFFFRYFLRSSLHGSWVWYRYSSFLFSLLLSKSLLGVSQIAFNFVSFSFHELFSIVYYFFIV